MSIRQSKDQRKVTGQFGEELASSDLTAKGYRIIARNWRCRTGEIDVIAEQDNILVFVEVRTRKTSGRFGTPKESVDYRKQKQVRDTVQVYLHQNKQNDRSIRIDVISIELTSDHELVRLEHIISAF